MDHQHALARLKSTEHLQQAFEYALNGRMNEEKFYDPTELAWASSHKAEIITEIQEELSDFDDYMPRVAFAYFLPKTELCDRRMVSLPLKDLVVRHALLMLFAERIECDLSNQCFANRRATGKNMAKKIFLEPFAEGGWQRFCDWQLEQCETHTVLIRTDISSFFDSISHEYLIDAVERHLLLPRHTPIMRLFRKLLKVEVMFYSSATGEIAESAIMHQGLTIGEATSSYLANIYLKDLDDAMVRLGNGYGRYADDMRIFAKSREEALHYLKILQQHLLKLGLNLNSAKTRIAENKQELEKIVSENHSLGPNYWNEKPEYAGIRKETDQPLRIFKKRFKKSDFKEPKDTLGNASDFCKFMVAHTKNKNPVVPLAKRQLWHINILHDIVVHQRGDARHATWLLVQSAVNKKVPDNVRAAAQTAVCNIILDHHAAPHARYRLLHHLLKQRANGDCYFNQLAPEHQENLKANLNKLLAAPAFELNLIAIHFARVIDMPLDELQYRVKTHCANNCEPVKQTMVRFPDIAEFQRIPVFDLDNELEKAFASTMNEMAESFIDNQIA